MGEIITRSAGAAHGQEVTPQQFREVIEAAGGDQPCDPRPTRSWSLSPGRSGLLEPWQTPIPPAPELSATPERDARSRC